MTVHGASAEPLSRSQRCATYHASSLLHPRTDAQLDDRLRVRRPVSPQHAAARALGLHGRPSTSFREAALAEDAGRGGARIGVPLARRSAVKPLTRQHAAASGGVGRPSASFHAARLAEDWGRGAARAGEALARRSAVKPLGAAHAASLGGCGRPSADAADAAVAEDSGRGAARFCGGAALPRASAVRAAGAHAGGGRRDLWPTWAECNQPTAVAVGGESQRTLEGGQRRIPQRDFVTRPDRCDALLLLLCGYMYLKRSLLLLLILESSLGHTQPRAARRRADAHDAAAPRRAPREDGAAGGAGADEGGARAGASGGGGGAAAQVAVPAGGGRVRAALRDARRVRGQGAAGAA